MPIAGFRDVQGVPVPFEDIDYIKSATRFNCSPATLKMLIDAAHSRDGIDFSASMLGSDTRQHLLRSRDYYPPTAQAMSGHMGTMRHQQVNVRGNGLIVEQRFTSARNPRLSGQIDHAAIIELTDDGTLIVDLYDLKTVKWYSTTLCAKDIWKNHADYAWQLNLCATMMEECGTRDINFRPCKHICHPHEPFTCLGTVAPILVRGLYLECISPDSTYKHQEEAARLGLPEYQKVIIKVDRKPADEVYRVYEEAMALRDKAIADGAASICKDRWSNKTISDLRCKHYCDVRAECVAFAKDHSERHPLIAQ